MKIVVIASSWAERILPQGEKEISGENLTAGECAKLAGFGEDDIGMLLVDGKRVADDFCLTDGATLKVTPPIMGG